MSSLTASALPLHHSISPARRGPLSPSASSPAGAGTAAGASSFFSFVSRASSPDSDSSDGSALPGPSGLGTDGIHTGSPILRALGLRSRHQQQQQHHSSRLPATVKLQVSLPRPTRRSTSLALLVTMGIVLLALMRVVAPATFSRQPAASVPLATLPASIAATLPPPPVSTLDHLVLVPGHAIWHTDAQAEYAAVRDADWILEPFQRDGDIRVFVEHIRRGVEVATQDPNALLVFSGGQTRRGADTTEGQSYARYAKAARVYDEYMQSSEGDSGGETNEFLRVTTEDFAADSFENVLFSVARFREFTGRFPRHITVVGFGLKRARFLDLHRAELRWPRSAFTYIGIDSDATMDESAIAAEAKAYDQFVRDPRGCRGALLAKKKARNPYRRVHPYETSAPELADVFEHCSVDGQPYLGPLPWDD